MFKFYNIHPATDSTHFQFNMSVDGGSNYNVTKTSTMFRSWHKEDDSATALAYDAGYDLAQSTAFQPLAQEVSNDNDNDCVGTLTIYNPSSTTFVKHFISTLNMVNAEPITMIMYGAGYGNTIASRYFSKAWTQLVNEKMNESDPFHNNPRNFSKIAHISCTYRQKLKKNENSKIEMGASG